MKQEFTQEQLARSTALGIKSESVEVFSYKQHQYQKLTDALKYAEIDIQRDVPDPEAIT